LFLVRKNVIDKRLIGTRIEAIKLDIGLPLLFIIFITNGKTKNTTKRIVINLSFSLLFLFDLLLIKINIVNTINKLKPIN